jgi:catechol 2,3-dioxygenase-like lactoylglutathione lyase family enzyme
VVSDLEKSKSFYQNILGAELYREYGGSSCVLRFLNNWLLLVLPGEPTKDKPEIYFQTDSNPNRVSHSFTIRVKNCWESYKVLKNNGAEFITPPTDWGYEVRRFFRDPDGHLFEISEFKGK